MPKPISQSETLSVSSGHAERGEEEIRLEKLQKILNAGINPYPSESHRTHSAIDVASHFNEIAAVKTEVTLCGRVRSIRLHGGSCFAHLEDESGKIQIYLKKDHLPEDVFESFNEFIDVADIIEVSGSLFATKRGEKTLLVTRYALLAKSLLPLPEKWHGLTDTEIRYRHRYLDLLSNEEVKDLFKTRAVVLKTTRDFFDDQGFLEVETPILQPIYGGAIARPFVTSHNALNANFYLRIAPELYLKRLTVGGFEKVYEIGKCFRNEGIDREHNPEFTMMEFYWAYANYEDGMKLTEHFFEHLVKSIKGNLEIEYEGKKINFTPPFERMTYRDLFSKHLNLDISKFQNVQMLVKEASSRNVKVMKEWGRGKILDEIYKELIRPNLKGPLFLTDHPVELSPLAKKGTANPAHVERYQLIVAGREVVNAYTELNDPIDQRERFLEQQRLHADGDEEAHLLDEDYITALMHGMPPTTGWGMGIDRIVAILTNSHSLKEVILFPTLKPIK